LGTPFIKVYDRAMTQFKDYRLDNLYQLDKESFYQLLKGFLLDSIDDFDGCLTDLSYDSVDTTVTNEDGTTTTTTEYFFNSDLSNKEIKILCLGLAIAWYNNDMQDVTQFRLHLNVREYKSHSEAQNIKQRSDVLDKMREELDRNITEYQISKLSELPFFGEG
jgi:hypothetical protein